MELTSLIPKALLRLNEILDLPFKVMNDDGEEILSLATVKVVRETAQTVLTTATRVDETQLRRRSVDVLPKLLDLLAAEEMRTLDLEAVPS